MLILQGRVDWYPRVRVEGLRRYAFIGDSHAFGAGVAPDQTLSANAERQLNEMLPSWAVECVNLGVSGYNLWNSWLAFKDLPQVYDGVVLALCHNDADLFGHTFGLCYPPPCETRWESNHSFGELIARGFDDITSFSRERSLQVAVVYYNAHGDGGEIRIGEILHALCSSRCLCFIDTLVHYRDRNLTLADMMVSSADHHPSAAAHEAVGRHLVATLKCEGWFREYLEPAISFAPDRILTAARAMVEQDSYPPDAALHWALRTMDAKSRLAHRNQAWDDNSNADFSTAARAVTEVLNTATRRWHVANRTRALVGDIAMGNHSLAWGLFSLQALRRKLDEIGFALEMGDWNRITACLLEQELLKQVAPAVWPSEAAGFFDGCYLELSRLRDTLAELSHLATPATTFGSPYDEAVMLADVEFLSQAVERTQDECPALSAAFARVSRVFNEACSALSEERIAQISSLISAAVEHVKGPCRFLPNLGSALKRICDAGYPPFTTIEVTISAAIGGKRVGMVGGKIEYIAPKRFPFRDAGCFWLDGSPALVKLHVPVFYAGRIALLAFVPKNTQTVETTLMKIEVYNRPGQRRIVEGASFYKNRNGQFVSPLIHLS